ncbi:MAG: hypothetical protein K2J41_06425 [Eubacterium sp.]|nr:hypothetical protein [Eubacterium sp.]
MIYTIVSLDDVFYVKDNATAAVNCARSSNPYDYIRDGFYLDNAMNGGEDYVRFNGNFSSYRTSNSLGASDKRKWSQCNFS